jgi:hypothetical protein
LITPQKVFIVAGLDLLPALTRRQHCHGTGLAIKKIAAHSDHAPEPPTRKEFLKAPLNKSGLAFLSGVFKLGVF